MILQQIRAMRLHLALCAAAGAWALPTFIGAPPSLLPPVIAFALILALYQFNRLSDSVEDRLNTPQEYRQSVEQRRLILAIALIGMLVAWALSILGGWSAVVIVAAVSAGAFYGWSVGSHPRLKDHWYLKNILPAGAWTLVMLGIGAAFARLQINVAFLYVFCYVTGAVWIVEVLNDLRDMLGDRMRGSGTMPLRIGPVRTIQLAQGFSQMLALSAALMLAFGILPPVGWLLVYHGLALSIYAGVFGKSGYVRDSHTLTIVNVLHLVMLGVAAILLR